MTASGFVGITRWVSWTFTQFYLNLSVLLTSFSVQIGQSFSDSMLLRLAGSFYSKKLKSHSGSSVNKAFNLLNRFP